MYKALNSTEHPDVHGGDGLRRRPLVAHVRREVDHHEEVSDHECHPAVRLHRDDKAYPGDEDEDGGGHVHVEHRRPDLPSKGDVEAGPRKDAVDVGLRGLEIIFGWVE